MAKKRVGGDRMEGEGEGEKEEKKKNSTQCRMPPPVDE